MNGKPFKKKELAADPYIAALNYLIAQNSSNEVCAEVYLEKANYLSEKRNLPLALDILNEAIQKYPNYKRINLLKNSKQQILNPNLNIESPQIIYPGNLFDLKVSHRNLDGFKINLYKVNLPVTSPKLNETLDKSFYKKYAQLITTEHYSLVRPVDYQQKDSVFKVKASALGIYLMDIIPDAKNGNVSTNFFLFFCF